METLGPESTPREAAAALEAAADARRAVRDRPWPTWLYPTNASLLGGLALAGLVRSSILATILVVVIGTAMVALNYRAGRQMGAPFAIPTSLSFRVLAATAGLFVIGSLFARSARMDWLIVACAVGAVVSYGLASLVHYRSSRK